MRLGRGGCKGRGRLQRLRLRKRNNPTSGNDQIKVHDTTFILKSMMIDPAFRSTSRRRNGKGETELRLRRLAWAQAMNPNHTRPVVDILPGG